ncbi:MAG: hypothetical protein WD467_01755 [Candidatus Saccharimonadales bacterium]
MPHEVLVHTGDGTGGSGKGTIGSWLSKQGVPHLDTGQGYRAVTEYWLRVQAEADANFDRSDTERLRQQARAFTEDEEHLAQFADSLSRTVAFGVEGVRIDTDHIPLANIPQVLYHDAINDVISFLARKEAVRSFCGNISVRFVLDAAERELDSVYLDGRSERNVMIRGLRQNLRLRQQARLGLPAFFKVDVVEAAHRTLSRDKDIPYRTLSNDDPIVRTRARSLSERNARDSDSSNHADPMALTKDHLVAWSTETDARLWHGKVELVVGRQPDGSDSRHVLFDTNGRTVEETRAEYGRWVEGVSQHSRPQ